jgi:hypothetical protein
VVASGGGLIGDSCVVYKEEGINLGVGLQKKSELDQKHYENSRYR